jgi:hypothetical protein
LKEKADNLQKTKLKKRVHRSWNDTLKVLGIGGDCKLGILDSNYHLWTRKNQSISNMWGQSLSDSH